MRQNYKKQYDLLISEIKRIAASFHRPLHDQDVLSLKKRAINRHKNKLSVFSGKAIPGAIPSALASCNIEVYGTSRIAKRCMIASFARDTLGFDEQYMHSFLRYFFTEERSVIDSLHLLSRFRHKELLKLVFSPEEERSVEKLDYALQLSGAITSHMEPKERRLGALSMFPGLAEIHGDTVLVHGDSVDTPTERYLDIGPAIALIAYIKSMPNPSRFDRQLTQLGYKIQ